jgi:hypothetical protein
MGQKRPVQIVNFVSKGTIEEGMLSVLAFKRSLAAGILDGGMGEISLGGSRLNRFMKDVENVTGHMGEGEAVSPAEEAGNVAAASGAEPVEAVSAEDKPGAVDAQEADDAASGQISADPWNALLQVGAQLVSALGAAGNPATPAHPWIERDPSTGVQSLKVPLPSQKTAGRIADVLSMLANTLRGQRP